METNELLHRKTQLKTDLKNSMIAGDAKSMISIQNELKDIDPLIYAAKVHEIRNELDRINARKREIEQETSALEALYTQKGRKLARANELRQQRALAVRKVEIGLYVADAELENLLERRRDLTTQLNGFINEKLGELEDEKFETV